MTTSEPSLSDFRRVVAGDHGLSIVSLARPDATVTTSLVNAGVLAHPVTAVEVVGFVVRGDAIKLRRLRRDPRATVTVRAKWGWVAAEGLAELVGPDDPSDGFDLVGLPQLLRDVFSAAGGTHDDWAAYDKAMAAERRTAVLLRPTRVYGNPNV